MSGRTTPLIASAAASMSGPTAKPTPTSRLMFSASGAATPMDAATASVGVAAPDAENIKREVGVGFAVGPDIEAAAEAISGVVRPLIEAVRNTFVYYAGGHLGAGIDVVVLTGGGAHLPGFG